MDLLYRGSSLASLARYGGGAVRGKGRKSGGEKGGERSELLEKNSKIVVGGRWCGVGVVCGVGGAFSRWRSPLGNLVTFF